MSIAVVFGIVLAACFAYSWNASCSQYVCIYETKTLLSIAGVIVSTVLIAFGMHQMMFKKQPTKKTPSPKTMRHMTEWITILGLIFLGSLSYTIASYYHLIMDDWHWTFIKALAIAIPFVLIEYQFSLRGNFYAHNILGLNAVQIVLITMTFYFINAWLLNYFILKKHKVIWWREFLAFLLLTSAFVITTMS